MSSESGCILLQNEAEAYVDSLQVTDITEIGSQRWATQHEYLEKLNMQAVMNASVMEEEYVKEFFITYDKVSMLIHDLLATEIWKQKVFPEFIEGSLEQSVMFPMYMVLYHEVTVANLLETILFHREACETAEDCIVDLIDYCYGKISRLLAESGEEDDDEDDLEQIQNASSFSSLEELQKQQEKMEFDISMKAVSIMGYITDHLSCLPLSASSRILNTLDVPLLLVQLVEQPPWSKETNGKLQKYYDGKWQPVPPSERFKMTKLDGQVWLSLFHLLMDENCQRKYEMDSYRKNTLLKLRSHLTEMTLDQIPALGELQRYLEQLSFMDPPQNKQELLLEQVPEIKDKLIQKYEGKWKKIAKIQSRTFFNPEKVDMKAQAKRLADTYNFDAIESLLPEPPKCALCGDEAMKRCSRCQNEWYCRRECQVKHWKKHKKACDLLVEASTGTEEDGKLKS